jgi:hypothetical protein
VSLDQGELSCLYISLKGGGEGGGASPSLPMSGVSFALCPHCLVGLSLTF